MKRKRTVTTFAVVARVSCRGSAVSRATTGSSPRKERLGSARLGWVGLGTCDACGRGVVQQAGRGDPHGGAAAPETRGFESLLRWSCAKASRTGGGGTKGGRRGGAATSCSSSSSSSSHDALRGAACDRRFSLTESQCFTNRTEPVRGATSSTCGASHSRLSLHQSLSGVLVNC